MMSTVGGPRNGHRNGAAAARGSAVSGGARDGGGGGGGRGQVPNNRIGIQLYTMRRLMPANDRQAVRRVLDWLGRVGYTQVEMAAITGSRHGRSATGSMTPGCARRPATIRWTSRCPTGSGIQVPEDARGREHDRPEAHGLRVVPRPYTAEYFTFLADRFNKAGAMAARAGLQFFYHNHDFEFTNKQADGSPLYDILLKRTDPNLVKFELDLFWIIEGGENPLEYLSRDPARFPAYHVKDRTWKDRPNAPDFEDVGPGSIDFPDIFAAGQGRRLDKHFFIEHDEPVLSHPGDPEAEYKTAQAGVNYLRTVRW